jgi:hypothetical protein
MRPLSLSIIVSTCRLASRRRVMSYSEDFRSDNWPAIQRYAAALGVSFNEAQQRIHAQQERLAQTATALRQAVDDPVMKARRERDWAVRDARVRKPEKAS